MGQLSKNPETLKEYLYAGKAEFTILNKDTHNRITLQFKKKQDADLYFVMVKDGDKRFAGTIFNKNWFNRGHKSQFAADSKEIKIIQWFVRNQNKLDHYNSVELYHNNRCAKCGKKLTVPESISVGLGAECAKSLKVSTLFNI